MDLIHKQPYTNVRPCSSRQELFPCRASHFHCCVQVSVSAKDLAVILQLPSQEQRKDRQNCHPRLLGRFYRLLLGRKD
jgi:hypothetical protein